MESPRWPRREHYRENILVGFNALAELYYTYWGEFFHLAVFEPGVDEADLATAYEKTHERYVGAIGAITAQRILDVACGGGAFSAWLADRTTGEVVGVDQSDSQLKHARRWLGDGRRPNLRFVQHDAMSLGDLAEPPFDAAVCLDAACYLPDRELALRGIAARLRPGDKLLLVDWCRAEFPLRLQRELILEPLCRYWAITDLETASGYRRSFEAAGFHIHELEDLSEQVCRIGNAAIKRRCRLWPSRSALASSSAWLPIPFNTAPWPSKQQRTSSKSRSRQGGG